LVAGWRLGGGMGGATRPPFLELAMDGLEWFADNAATAAVSGMLELIL
jgi:hypothetical protein